MMLKRKRNPQDVKIDKLQQINGKLTSKMKELNSVLEKTLEKANTKKMAKMNKDKHVIKSDPEHQILVKEKQLKNTLV